MTSIELIVIGLTVFLASVSKYEKICDSKIFIVFFICQTNMTYARSHNLCVCVSNIPDPFEGAEWPRDPDEK